MTDGEKIAEFYKEGKKERDIKIHNLLINHYRTTIINSEYRAKEGFSSYRTNFHFKDSNFSTEDLEPSEFYFYRENLINKLRENTFVVNPFYDEGVLLITWSTIKV